MIADDHAVVRGGLEQLLSTADDIDLVGIAANGLEAVETVQREQPDVVLMDLSMPELDGVEATRRIVDRDPDARVVVLTSFGDDRHIADALHAGAVGYVLKHAGPDELLDAIRAAAARATRRSIPRQPACSSRAAGSDRPRGNAQRARGRGAPLVADGLANKPIARKLSISERTVKAHLTNIFARLGVTDRTQAALWAKDHLPPDA